MNQKQIRKKRDELSKRSRPLIIALAELRLNCSHFYKKCEWCGKRLHGDGDEFFSEEEFILGKREFKKRSMTGKEIQKEFKALEEKISPIRQEARALIKACEHPQTREDDYGDGVWCLDCDTHIW